MKERIQRLSCPHVINYMPKKMKKKSKVVRPVATKVKKARRRVLKKGPIVRAAEMIGGIVAPGIGSTVGRMVGYGGQALYNYISGSGAYTISKNSLMGVSNVPSFGETTIRIRAREYLSDVNGSTAFKNVPYIINPGNAATFPWLSTVATQFQQYEINGLVFEFVSTSSNALSSTNTALGKVVMATSYNVSAPVFPDVKTALITQFSNMGKPADNLVHAIECRRGSSALDNLFVRATGNLVPDPKFYDFGQFQFITEGMQAVADIGGLWVSYDITLSKPTLEAGDYDIPSQTISFHNPGLGVYYAPNTSPTDPDTGVRFTNISPTQGMIQFVSPTVGDKYLIVEVVEGAAAAFPTWSISLAEGVAPWGLYGGEIAIGGTGTYSQNIWAVEITSTSGGELPYPGYLLGLSGAIPGGWSHYCIVTKLNPSCPVDIAPTLMGKRSLAEVVAFYADRKVERKERVPRPPVEVEQEVSPSPSPYSALPLHSTVRSSSKGPRGPG